MIAKVVVPLDGSLLAARALGPARALAERTGASLLLLMSVWGGAVGEPGEDLAGQAAALDFERVETLVVRDRSAGRAIVTQSGEPGSVVCMSTHGRSGIGQAVLGSVAADVLQRSDRPVLLLGPSLERGAWESEHWFADGKLLVAVDGSKASEAVVPAAAAWSRTLHLPSLVLQVLLPTVGLILNSSEHAAESGAVRSVAERLPQVDGATGWEVLHGHDVAASLLEYANRLPTTLIAMTTHGRSGLARVALGSVATRVVHKSPCPVLVVRSPHLAA
jgi:nucleotide-binding universal stress UspA family protein